MRGCFSENRHVVFFWKLPGERPPHGAHKPTKMHMHRELINE
jgi:hypothetical protein